MVGTVTTGSGALLGRQGPRARSNGGGSKVAAAKMGPSTWVVTPVMSGS